MTLDKVKLKTINNQSVIGDGNISVGGSSVDIVTSWENTLSDTKVPSEKLSKNTIDLKVAIAQGSGNANKNVVTDNSGNITTEAKPTIPTDVSDLTDTTDIIPTTIGDLSGSRDDIIDIIYPVGSIYMSITSTNPNYTIGGTWEQIAQGRTIIGEGTGTDSNSESKTFSYGTNGGEYNHTLSTSEIPSHTHNSKTLTGTTRIQQYNGSEASTTGIISQSNNNYNLAKSTSSGTNFGSTTLTVNATHTHDSVGSDNAHNNLPPYFVCYIWKRTA